MPSRSEGQGAITTLNGKVLKNRTIDVIRAHALSRRALTTPFLEKILCVEFPTSQI